MSLSLKERASLGGRASAIARSPEQRREQARKAHLASAVNAVVNRAPDLTPEQITKLRAIFGGAAK